MIEYFNGVLERLSTAMLVAVICSAIGLVFCGLCYMLSEDEEERTNAGKYCKGFLIAIAIEASAMIWLPTHL